MPDQSVTAHPLPLGGGFIYVLFIGLMVLSCGMGRYTPAGSRPLSLEALYAKCGLPASCDTPLACDGQAVTIAARVDPSNIFEKRQYPQLPYEKFKLVDGKGRSVEVWPQSTDNRPIFDKLAARSSDRIVVHGLIATFKMPIMGTCNQGIKVLIDAADQIEFQK